MILGAIFLAVYGGCLNSRPDSLVNCVLYSEMHGSVPFRNPYYMDSVGKKMWYTVPGIESGSAFSIACGYSIDSVHVLKNKANAYVAFSDVADFPRNFPDLKSGKTIVRQPQFRKHVTKMVLRLLKKKDGWYLNADFAPRIFPDTVIAIFKRNADDLRLANDGSDPTMPGYVNNLNSILEADYLKKYQRALCVDN